MKGQLIRLMILRRAMPVGHRPEWCRRTTRQRCYYEDLCPDKESFAMELMPETARAPR